VSLAPGERRPCSACGVEIIGARSSSNPKSVMPIVLEPHPNGNVLLQQKDGTMTAFVLTLAATSSEVSTSRPRRRASSSQARA